VVVGTLPNTLITLQLKLCHNLRKIEGLAQLKKLRVLNVYECFELEELQGVAHLGSLEMFDARKCPKLQFHERLPPRLTYFLQASSRPWRSEQVMCMALLLITFTCNNPAWPWRSRQVMYLAILCAFAWFCN